MAKSLFKINRLEEPTAANKKDADRGCGGLLITEDTSYCRICVCKDMSPFRTQRPKSDYFETKLSAAAVPAPNPDIDNSRW
jgi:hypothetical protein